MDKYKIIEELCIWFSTIFLCFIFDISNIYNILILCLLLRIWIENKFER